MRVTPSPFGAVPTNDSEQPEEEPTADQISSGNSGKQTANAKSIGEKRKAAHSDELLMDFLANLHAETNSRLEVIS